MAEVVDELMVRLGLDQDKQSFQQAEASFASIRRGAMALAGTVGAGLGFQSLTTDVAKANDTLGLQADRLGVSEKALDSFGFALERAGGQSENAAQLLGQANNAIDQLQLGNIPGIDIASQWGLDPDSLMESANAMQFMLRLTDQLEGMSTQQQRNVLDAFGLGGEGTFNLLTGGRNALEDTMNQAQLLSPTLGQLVDDSREFRESLTEMTRAVRGVTNLVSSDLIDDLTQFSDFMTGFLTDNRDLVAEVIGKGPTGAGAMLGDAAMDYVTSLLPEGVRKYDWEPFSFGGDEGQSISDQAIRAAISVSTPRSIPVDQPRNAGVDAPSMVAVEKPEPVDINVPPWLEVNAPDKIGVEQPRNAGVDAPSSIPVDDVDPILLDAVMWQESRDRHRDESGNLILGPELPDGTRARGAYQIRPSTARDPGYGVEPLRNDSREEHRRLADDYLDAMTDLFDGNTRKALAAYNAGPGNVQDAVDEYGKQWMSGLKTETQLYVPQVMERYREQGGSTTNDNRQNITIEINGATDPIRTGDELEKRLRMLTDRTREDTANEVY